MRPKLVLFDLGNVLVRFTPESFWMVLGLQSRSEQAPYVAAVKRAGERFETGQVKTNGFFDELEQVFNSQFRREHLRRAIGSVLTTPIPHMNRIVSLVTQRVSTALVSNTNEFHYAYCMDAIPALKMLPRHYLSFQLGVMKPNPEFYDKVLRGEKVKPEETLFIDDVPENVEGAETVGMHGILFTSSNELENNILRIL